MKLHEFLLQLRSGLDNVQALAYDLAHHTDLAPALSGDQEPLNDAQGALSQRRLSLTNGPYLQFGTIVDYIPSIGCYKVFMEGCGSAITCYKLRFGGTTISGVADVSTYSVGTSVFVINHPNSSGFIVGAVPMPTTASDGGFLDQLSQASHGGLQAEMDKAHLYPMDSLGNEEDHHAGIEDRNAGNPLDQTGSNEFAYITETGLCVSLDSYMAQMRVDEMTGIFMYYWDQFLRLAGTNLQIWGGAGLELTSFDDEGEHAYFKGIAVYPWESRCALKKPEMLAKEYQAEEVQISKAWYSRIEGEEDNYQSFFRAKNYGGYLGQGFRRMLSTPYLKEKKDKQKYDDEFKFPGLFEEQITLAGHYALRTALGLTIGKRPVIPTPKRLKEMPDEKGDKTTGKDAYKASSYFGDGKEHKCFSEIKADSDYPQLQRALGVLDLHAHIFNWEGPHPFHYHEKDYLYPQESDMEEVKENQEPIKFSQLNSKPVLDPPEPKEIEIDHRTGGKAKIFPNSSSLTFTDDGGIILTDGFGAQIRMTGGNIHITAPGDVFVEAGRNAISWAGRDIMLRAYQSVDVTATENDVRLKAEKNMQLLAANGGGMHGMLIESRSDACKWPFTKCGHDADYSGIVLLAKKSAIVSQSKAWFTKTTGTGYACGGIIFDSADGSGSIALRAKTFDRWITGYSRDFFIAGSGIEKSSTVRTCAWNGADNLVSGDLYVRNKIRTHSILTGEGGIASLGGTQSVSDIHWSKIKDPSPFRKELEAKDAALERQIEKGNKEHKEINKEWYTPTDKPGNKNFTLNGEFGLRIDSDYKSDSYVLFESHWGQQSRITGEIADVWTEKAVKNNVAPAEKTYPFPGKVKLTEEEIYYQQNLKFVTPDTGASKDRPGEHEDSPKYEKPEKKKIDGNYPIIGT